MQQQQSVLPNILEVAIRNNLQQNPKTIGKKEVAFKCPFCLADSNRRNKFYLSINESKNVFKCWYCKESGGVLRFISLLEGKSEQDLIEEVRQQAGSTYQKHPAERLTSYQLKLIGYQKKIDWITKREFDYIHYKEFREKVWNEWNEYVRSKKRYCYQMLFVGLISGNLQKAIQEVEAIEKNLQVKFLDKLLEVLFQEDKNMDTFYLESLACELTQQVHPFETYLGEIEINFEENNEKEKEIEKEEGEEFEMLNVCTFVGRLSSEVELKYTPNGKPVAQFGLALTRAIPNSNGEREADFIRCIVWNKPAETMANNLSKGDVIGIQARVQTRSYDQDGKRVYVTEFVVEGLPTFIKVKKWNEGQQNSSNQKPRNQQQLFQNDPFINSGQPIDLSDDDLPF